jgi:2'-5' RNA ligase
MIRLFVGLPLPDAVCDRLAMLVGGVPGARWEDKDNYHITLRFIGEVDEGTAADVDAALDLVVAQPFTLTLNGVDSFGNGHRRRTLWAALEPSEPLRHLHDKVESAVVRAGLPREVRKFAPHVTLARIGDSPPERVGRFIAERNLFQAGPFTVDRFVLYESRLGRSGSTYPELRSYPLGGWRPGLTT